MTLADLNPGESGRIVEINAASSVRHRLMDFGLRRGEVVTMVRRAPLTDPIEFRLRGGYISLRRTDAECIEVAGVE